MTLPNKPVSARIQWTWNRMGEKGMIQMIDSGWLTLYPNGVAFAVQDNPDQYSQGLPRVDHPFDQAKFEEAGGKILHWIYD